MKYNKVYYYNKVGERKEFLAKELDDKGNIAALKKHQIFDDTESVLLTPIDFVNHENRSSFFRALQSHSNKLLGPEETFEHDSKVGEVYENLISSDRIKIWYKDFTGFPPKNTTLLKLQSYTWNFEVSRELFGYNKRVRFDLFGHCSKGAISKNRPEIIIEIVEETLTVQDKTIKE